MPSFYIAYTRKMPEAARASGILQISGINCAWRTGESAAAPAVAEAARRFQGSAPSGGHECDRQAAGATRAGAAGGIKSSGSLMASGTEKTQYNVSAWRTEVRDELL